MTRTELIAELERLAHVFEGHPIHSDMSDTMRWAIRYLKNDDIEYDGWAKLEAAFKPSPPSSGPLPRVPDDT